MKNDIDKRKCLSWINQFVEWTEGIEAPPVFRRWSAITAIAATLEQKVWLETFTTFYPNVYTFLVGPPGVGKSRSIKAVLSLMHDNIDLPLAPTSMTMASMVDVLGTAKRQKILHIGAIPNEWNSMLVAPDEFSAFMHKVDHEIEAGLVTFYDCGPYIQARRTKDLRVGIPRPQINILTGATPTSIANVMPQTAWGQGLTSRIFFIYGDKKITVDIFDKSNKPAPPVELKQDLKTIAGLWGEFGWTPDYQRTAKAWRDGGETPVPTHPRLEHYNTRRYGHVIKLSMIAAIDRGNELMLEKRDFETALSWLLEAEKEMPKMFDSVVDNQDSMAMDEIHHFVYARGPRGVSESAVLEVGRRKLKHAVHTATVIDLLIRTGSLRVMWVEEETGFRWLQAKEYSASASSATQLRR